MQFPKGDNTIYNKNIRTYLGGIDLDDIKPEQLNEIYKDFCAVIGLENTLMVFSTFKGQQVSFPVKLVSSDYTKSKIIEEYDGTNLKQIAKKYDYSERWVREILKSSINK